MFIKIKDLKFKKANNSYIIYYKKRFKELHCSGKNTRIINSKIAKEWREMKDQDK